MYIELHARSAFSFLEGASVPEELAERVRGTAKCRPWRCSIATAFTARRVFIWPPKKLGSARAHRRGSHFGRWLALSVAG